MQSRRGRRARAGFTLVEVLVAGLILSIGILAISRLWIVSHELTIGTDDTGIAYNLGRMAMEHTKLAGFHSAPEGSATAHFDANQNPTTQAQARFAVTTTIATSPPVSGSGPDPSAIRTVTVSVRRIATNQVLYRTDTFLVRAGI
ncbi:MAG TPA: prepilin-type N-terminal cleavage/methylation domain-containing protein [Chthonomonadales bacterium]|nr:prepilin-type N-terminal cleavage/methylation domain-containing protein [Chthonomonadales bacterium]